jgi:putative SOS response-associated peptidase YedK
MCYYNGQKVTRDEYIRLKNLEKLVANYKFLNRDVEVGFDFGPTVVLKPIPGKQDFEIVTMEWGFIPDPLAWPFIETREQLNNFRRGFTDARGKFVKYDFLNAVSEELLFKNKVYRRAALERRCIILSTGFYDWRHIFPLNKRTGEPRKTAEKYPYRVMLNGREYFWMAGIWNPFEDADTGEYVESCAIVTTAANEVMEQIHNSKKRMPTMLTDDLAFDWLFKPMNEKEITALAQWQIPYQDLSYYTLKKDFLNSTDPLQPHYYKELEPLAVPGGDKNTAVATDTNNGEKQLGLF